MRPTRFIALSFAAFLFSCCTPSPQPPPANAPVETPSAEAPAALTETEKIEALIRHVADAKGLIFIRNGEEHSAADAAEHMRRKWRAAGDRVSTAEEFIEHCASRSSMSGKPYTIRTADGKEFPAGEYLRARLAEVVPAGRG